MAREEVAQHNSAESAYIVVNGKVLDVTDLIKSGIHPGGSAILLKFAGKRDATKAFSAVHTESVLKKFLKPEHHVGVIDASDGAATPEKEKEMQSAKRPGLNKIIGLRDFELAAEKVLPSSIFAFLKAGADSEYSAQWNRDSWKAIRFRPRVLRPIESVDTSTLLFGQKLGSPFFIGPAGGGKMVHEEGEVLMTKAAQNHNVLHWVCNMAGSTKEEIAAVKAPKQVLFWQIYAMSDLSVTEKEIKDAIKLGYKGFALTVDGIRLGKRERDMRLALSTLPDEDDEPQSTSGISARAPTYSSFTWQSAVKWLRSLTSLPIAIKGIQTWEDAQLCMEYGIEGVWLSNHGGRQLEGAPAAAETLVSIREKCPQVFDKCQVIVDGGITRGTDVVKAIALGATAVGLGRPFLYSLAFGQNGVEKAISILQKEIETTMALLGVTSVAELSPNYVDARPLIYASAFPREHL